MAAIFFTALGIFLFWRRVADIVVFNDSSELTDKRVNSTDSAVSNHYSNMEYHKQTLEKIKKL